MSLEMKWWNNLSTADKLYFLKLHCPDISLNNVKEDHVFKMYQDQTSLIDFD